MRNEDKATTIKTNKIHVGDSALKLQVIHVLLLTLPQPTPYSFWLVFFFKAQFAYDGPFWFPDLILSIEREGNLDSQQTHREGRG